MTFPLPRDELLAKFHPPGDQAILDEVAKHFAKLRKQGAWHVLMDCTYAGGPEVSRGPGAFIKVTGMGCLRIAHALREAGYGVSELSHGQLDVEF